MSTQPIEVELVGGLEDGKRLQLAEYTHIIVITEHHRETIDGPSTFTEHRYRHAPGHPTQQPLRYNHEPKGPQ